MDSTAHRTIQHARAALVDDLLDTADRHQLNPEQRAALADVTAQLWRLMMDDPAPPECQNCAEPLTQPATGRPRRYCSAACRQADYRYRQP